jgi:hypothetical protein
MMQVDIFINMIGRHFSPAKLGQMTGHPVENSNEPESIGNTGKYRGKPIPYGAGEWRFSTGKDMPYGPVFETAVQMLERYIHEMRQCGAEEIVLHFQVYYASQCNLEFSPSELNRISSLCVPFTISCEQLAGEEEESPDIIW